jgi:hypothetical protein
MGKRDSDIVGAAAEHVFALFRDASKDGLLLYHGYDRARELARATKEIAKGCELDEEQTQIAMLAAWFHDAGHATGPSGDRAQSSALMRSFLEEQGQPPELIEAVEKCINGANEQTHDAAAQEVLHDALLAPTATKSYLRKLRLLRLEKQRRGDPPLTDVEWTSLCIEYVEQHPFRGRHAQIEYNGGRAENLVRLHRLLNEQREEAAALRADEEKAVKGLGKTVEGVCSEITRSQIKLFDIADRRTATMVHVNAIMISLTAALLLRHIDNYRQLLIPTLALLAVNLLVIFISIASMRVGRLTMGLRPNELAAHDQNLLALVSQAPVDREEYTRRIEGLAQDVHGLRRTMIEATYFARRMLDWRGRMLRMTYDVFIVGLAVSVAAFAVAILHK